ncbi:hypothetical protein [Psittacicella hinzii]|uniref:hypothetical protein n=1 Tax=Psittacicella hinzii TaxID=2028575 RepID=UPI001CA71A72|nr:hypothetical protein [Psittacicella hinzii]
MLFAVKLPLVALTTASSAEMFTLSKDTLPPVTFAVPFAAETLVPFRVKFSVAATVALPSVAVKFVLVALNEPLVALTTTSTPVTFTFSKLTLPAVMLDVPSLPAVTFVPFKVTLSLAAMFTLPS